MLWIEFNCNACSFCLISRFCVIVTMPHTKLHLHFAWLVTKPETDYFARTGFQRTMLPHPLWQPVLYFQLEFQQYQRHGFEISLHYKTGTYYTDTYFEVNWNSLILRPNVEKETCLWVIFKRCTISLKDDNPAYFKCRSFVTHSDWSKRHLCQKDLAFHWWRTCRHLWLSRYCNAKMAAELVEAMVGKAWWLSLDGETDAGIWAESHTGCGLTWARLSIF